MVARAIPGPIERIVAAGPDSGAPHCGEADTETGAM